jgi:hypothetical protein
MDLVVPDKKTLKEEFSLSSLKDKPRKVKEIRAEKVELSDGIKRFDNRPRKTASPFDYNTVALSRKNDYMPSADQMITNPTYNTVGKFLGVDTIHDWSKYSDKVKTLVDWAEIKTGKKDINAIMHFLNGALNAAPSFGMNNKRIDQLFLYAKLNMNK